MLLKKISAATVMFGIAGTAFAVSAGFYMGAQVGQSNTHNETLTVPFNSPTEPTNTGPAARIFMGGNFNQYAAMELGVTRYASSEYNPSNDDICSSATIRESGVDLVGKGIWPMWNSGIDVFGKAGIAYMRSSQSSCLSPPSGATNSFFRPTATVGVSYDISQSWVADVSASRVFSHGAGLKNADFIALGISYHFVDHYCGQFLC